MFCRTCGAEIRDGSKFCSECGAAQQDVTSSPNTNTRNHIPPINQLNQVTVEKAPYNMMCIIGLILSLFSVLFNLFALLSMAGIIVSVIGLMTCQQKNERGKVLAILGIVISLFSMLSVVFLLLRFAQR